MTNSTVYSTTSGEKSPSFEELSLELRYELGLPTEESSREDDYYPYDPADYLDEWCFVCSRPTDHRGEHDDLVDQGLASYDSIMPMVHRVAAAA